MAKFFQRRSKAKGAETTPVKTSNKAQDMFMTPGTVTGDLTLLEETPEAHESNDHDNEEPWDFQRTYSEDAASDVNSNTTPTPIMRRKIQERMNRLRDDGDDDNAHDTAVEPKIIRLGRRPVKSSSAPTEPEAQAQTQKETVVDASEEPREKPELSPEDLENMPEDEKQEYIQALRLCGLVDNSQPTTGGGDNLCDYTLSALNDLCGIQTAQDEPNKKPDPAGKTVSTRPLPGLKPPYGVEEHTAIEVEYIEPERRQDVKSDMSTGADAQTKNRLVQVMARRAKQDFETKKGMPATVASPTPPTEAETNKDTASTPDNVYSSFSSSEKRMFLKLINSGLTPSDATAQVLKARQEGPVDDDAPTGSPSLMKNVPKDNGVDSEQAVQVVSGQNPEQFAKSGIGYYDGVNKDPQEDAEDRVSEELSGLDRKSRKNRMARLAKFGFGRPKGQQLGDYDDDDGAEQQEASRDPPEALPSSSRSPPPSPPKPLSTVRSAPSEDVLKDLENVVAESRIVFKPISPQSPEPEEGGDFSPEHVPPLQSCMSGDSLLDGDGTQPETEPEIMVGAAPESAYSISEGDEEKQEITAEEDMVTARLLGGPTQAPNHSSPPRTMITEGLDLDVETAYMNSTEMMSHYNGTSVMGDQTVRTHGTYATTGTNYTTSTRSRRPGASKQRLSSQQTGGSGASALKYKGWQASIQEAAAGIGKVWDPVKGWIGYENPEDEKKEDALDSLNSLPVEYRNIAAIPETAPALSVASPSSLDVLADKDAANVYIAGGNLLKPHHGAVNAKKDTTTQAKSRGWMETMKEATAKLNSEGKRWDPERGWVSPDGRDVGRYRGVGVDGQVESDTQDFGTVQLSASAVKPDTLQKGPREPSGQQPVHFLREDPSGETPSSDEVPLKQQQADDTLSDHQSMDTSLRSPGNTGRYIQIGDSGSVSSYYYGKPSEKLTPSKELGQTLESTPEGKDEDDCGSNSQPTNTLLVNVKKEKVDPSEASMFPEIPKGSRRNQGSTGPVDLDDHIQDDAMFGTATGFSWDEDDFGNSSVPKKSSGGMSSSSTIPRLPAPTRDTSPIRGRGKSASRSTPQHERTEVATAQQVTPSPVKNDISWEQSRAEPLPMVSPVTPMSTVHPPGHGPDRSLTKTTTPMNDSRTVNTPEPAPNANNVRELHQYWEKRSVEKAVTPPSAEWKSFLSRKVMAENAASGNIKKPSVTGEDDRDTLFDFGSESAYSGAVRRPKSPTNHDTDPSLRQLQEISNLSPIRTVHDDDDDDDDMNAPSEVSTAVVQGKTFMERIQACAAPMIPKQLDGVNCSPMPLAHLNFMRRNNPVADAADSQPGKLGSKSVPPSLYGKPDVIVEADDEDASADDRRKQASRKPHMPSPSRGHSDVSSVISDEQFGQKTAYLEAIAMKAAVSGSKKTRRTRSSGSETSGNIKHSESWQRFLDKKNAATSEDQESVQRAAEEYAARKIDQMIARNRPADFEARPMEDATGAFPSVKNASRFKVDNEWKTESTRAAEELAAARVQAMKRSFQAPQTPKDEEGEI